MVAKLYLSPSFETTLLYAVEHIGEVRRNNPLLPVHVLVPTAQSVQAVRQRLGDAVGIYLYQFYGLGQAGLDAAGQLIHRLGDTTSRRLVHHLLEQMNTHSELSTFAAVWDKPGFNQTLVDWLREMKTQGIFPEDFAAHAQETGRERDQQLSLLYTRYQLFLQERDLSDADGLLWLAAETLESNLEIFRSPGPFLAIGFDQFNPIQEHILRALTGRFSELAIFLQWDVHRPESSLALARSAETRSRLRTIFPDIQEVQLPERGQIAERLRYLRQTLFETGSGQKDPPNREADEIQTVRAFEAPSREVEVRLALREIKRLLLQGIPAEEIVLVAPHPAIYQRIVEQVAEEYGIPVRLEQALAANPAVQALLNLIALPTEFPWRETLDALRSPYLRQPWSGYHQSPQMVSGPWLTAEQVDRLERLSRERPVLRGRDQWLFALEPLAPSRGEGDEDLGPPRLASLLTPEDLGAIRRDLMAFFDHLTPPASATHREYTLWLQERILGLRQPVEDNTSDETDLLPATLALADHAGQGIYAERDLRALSLVLQELRALVDAAELIQPEDSGRVPWSAYRSDLLNVLSARLVPPDVLTSAVRFDRLGAGRERPVDYLFVLGLSEGEFPSPPPPDPLFAAVEREQHPLPLRRPYPADDASLFWLVLSNCRRGLTLFRPKLDDSGAPWVPSPFWEAVLEKTPVPIVEVPIGYVPSVDEAASPAELLIALAISHSQAVPPELADAWWAAGHACRVIDLRRSWMPAREFEGFLRADDLQGELAARYDTEYTWSASRLNRYGMCPFGFFAQYVLRLEGRPDPEEGLDAMQRGSLLHTVLEHLHRSIGAEGLALTAEHLAAVLRILDLVCDELFPHAPARYGFRPSALWRYEQGELRRLLRALLSWECSQDHAYRPYRQELRFGVAGADLPRYRFEDSQGTDFYLHGVIDRIDRDANSGALRVLDYKSGSTAYSGSDIASGRALQAPLYALAAEGLLGEQVIESAYLLIPKRDFSGRLAAPNGVSGYEPFEVAVDQAGRFVQAIRQGEYPSLPSKPSSGVLSCSNYCEFVSLCRVDRHAIAKAKRVVE